MTEVIPLDPLTDVRWDALVSEFPQATAFHSSAWARVLHSTYGYKPAYFAGMAGTGADFLMPLMQVRTAFSRPRAVCLPFTDECAPLGRTPEGLRRALKESRDRACEAGCSWTEIRSDTNETGVPPGPVQFYGHLLDLENSPDALLRRMHPSIRQGLRKADRSGLMVTHPESLEGIHAFYRLQCQTRRRHGLPPQPFRLFLNIQREFIRTGRGFISMVSQAGAPIAAVLFLVQGNRATYKFGASLPEAASTRATTLAMWTAIRRCSDSGVSRIDFGRTEVGNSGLRAYKLRWGTQEYDIRYTRYARSGRNLPPRKVAVHGFHNHLFRIMPSPLSRLVGAFLYRLMG